MKKWYFLALLALIGWLAPACKTLKPVETTSTTSTTTTTVKPVTVPPVRFSVPVGPALDTAANRREAEWTATYLDSTFSQLQRRAVAKAVTKRLNQRLSWGRLDTATVDTLGVRIRAFIDPVGRLRTNVVRSAITTQAQVETKTQATVTQKSCPPAKSEAVLPGWLRWLPLSLQRVLVGLGLLCLLLTLTYAATRIFLRGP